MAQTSEHTFDLVSVGGGLAGMTAAVRAAQLGLKTAVLERSGDELYFCNSRVAGGVMHISYTDPSTPPDTLAKAVTEITAGYADAALVRALTANALRAVQWLQSVGVQFALATDAGWRNWLLAPVRPPATNLEWHGIGADMSLRQLETQLRERGGTLQRDTQVLDLIVENGAVAGVRARQGGVERAIRARAVVLADGGFQGNPDMVGRYISRKPQALKQRGTGTGRGDGIRMAQAAGAALSDMQAFYGHVLSRDAMHNERVWPYPQLDELAASGLLVNAAGQRLGDEGQGGVYIANLIARADDPLATTVVFDDAIWQGPGRAASIPPNAALLEHGGTLFKAGSLRELATMANIDAEGLEATVRDYNAALAANATAKLNPPRSSARRKAMPITTAPFYAAPACCGLTYTMGGVRTNGNAQVLREDGSIMRGLYAAGATTGGLEGGPVVGYAGGLMKALTFGLLAAEHLANSK